MKKYIIPALLSAALMTLFSCGPDIKPQRPDDQKQDTTDVNPPVDTHIVPPVVPPDVDTTVVDPVDTTDIPPVVPPEDEEVYEASLSYGEFESVDEAKKYVAGYGSPQKYTNASGTWTICAYNYNNNSFQINSNKVAYIGTPKFDKPIRKIEIETVESFKDEYYLCSEPGSTQVAGIFQEFASSGMKTTADVEGIHYQLFVRASACARIKTITVWYGGEGGSGDDHGDDDDGDDEGDGHGDDHGDDGGDDSGDEEQHNYGKYGWFELPAINDADGNGVDDDDSNVYYAYHQFKMNNRQYRNYTVCYSAEHHCPLWVAAPRHDCYEGGTDRTNAYARDPDIPGSIQYSSKSTGGGCNKGHMLGSAERTCCTEANKQVFYYTNIAPQLSSGFNTGGGGWNLLEDYIDTRVVRDTLYEVVGCYFEKYTDGYGNTVSPKSIEFGGRSDVDMPTMFYYAVLRTKKGTSGKKVTDCSASELQCVAFVRSHINSLKGQKPSSRELMSIADLEKLTGFTYFPNVPNAPKSTYNASDWGL